MDKRYRFKTLDQFLRTPKPAIYYHVKPLLPVGGILVLAGDVKTFKSYLALNIGYALAAGTPVLDYWATSKPLSVLYIEGEVGEYELDERGTVIHNYHGSETAAQNLKIISKDLQIQLDTPEGMKIITDEVEGASPDIFIIDPIVEFHSQDENKHIEMKKMMAPLKRLLYKKKCSLIIVSHTTKPAEGKSQRDPSSVRGGYLAGTANSVINIVKPVAANDAYIELNFTTRSSKKLKPMGLYFDETKGGFNGKKVQIVEAIA